MVSPLRRSALGVCAVAFLLAGCTGSRSSISTLVPQGQVHRGSSSGNCPSLSGGTGILPDGDFSQAPDPGDTFKDYKKGQIFAPDWQVGRRTIDFYGSKSSQWNLDGLCSVDLDGNQAGGIFSAAFSTKPNVKYTLTFVFSGNGGQGPTAVKTMKVTIDHQFTQYTWDTTGGNDVQNGDYSSESWKFTATGHTAILNFTSQDPKSSASGPVIGGIAITKS